MSTRRLFAYDFQNAVIKALGLEGRPIRKLRLEMEINKPVLLYMEEFADFEDHQPYLIANVLELATWQSPQPQPQPQPDNEE